MSDEPMAFVKSTAAISGDLQSVLQQHSDAMAVALETMQDGAIEAGAIQLLMALQRETAALSTLLSEMLGTIGGIAVRTGNPDLAMGPGAEF